jgi:magnesium-transporting ATPase (P-type)
MWKHIIIQSIFELIVLVFIYIYGPSFIKEDKEQILLSHYELFSCFGALPGNLDYFEDYDNILDGRENYWSKNNYIDLDKIKNDKYDCRKFLSNNENEWENFSLFDAFDYYNYEYGSTTHMTLIFNIFVFYTLFNQFNCRIIDDSKNILTRINKGFMFLVVTLCEMLIQIFIIEFGSGIFHCVDGGLSFKQWLICLSFSLTTFLVNFLTKLVPLEEKLNFENKDKINDLSPINLEMEQIENSRHSSDDNIKNN